jgi:hypothetical protein
MSERIGYYVHHHGAGHRRRAAAIAAAYGDAMTLIGTGVDAVSDDFPCLDLPDDRLTHGIFDGEDGATRPASLHYAPLHHRGVQDRVAQIAGWIAANRPRLMIVDVSVEVAMLARLASVPFVYVRLGGKRDDRPHRDAFAGAQAMLAPFPELLDDPATSECLRARTFYAPGIVGKSRPQPFDPDRVLVVMGTGGDPADGAYWAAVATAHPERRWRVIGPVLRPDHLPSNLDLAGWVADGDAEIAAAGVVIGGAGDGVVNAVLAHRRPFVCRPEARPFAEQVVKATRLAALGAAIVSEGRPDPADWPALLTAAEQQPGRRPAALHANDGAQRAARWLKRLVLTRHPATESVL